MLWFSTCVNNFQTMSKAAAVGASGPRYGASVTHGLYSGPDVAMVTCYPRTS